MKLYHPATTHTGNPKANGTPTPASTRILRALQIIFYAALVFLWFKDNYHPQAPIPVPAASPSWASWRSPPCDRVPTGQRPRPASPPPDPRLRPSSPSSSSWPRPSTSPISSTASASWTATKPSPRSRASTSPKGKIADGLLLQRPLSGQLPAAPLRPVLRDLRLFGLPDQARRLPGLRRLPGRPVPPPEAHLLRGGSPWRRGCSMSCPSTTSSWPASTSARDSPSSSSSGGLIFTLTQRIYAEGQDHLLPRRSDSSSA